MGRVLWYAATKPLNVIVLAIMLAAALLVTPWIALAAVPVYGVLVATTLRDPKELDRAFSPAGSLPAGTSLAGIDSPLRLRIAKLLDEHVATKQQVLALDSAPEGMTSQLDKFAAELVTAATRATDIDRYLATVDLHALVAKEREYTKLGEHSERAASAASALREQITVIKGLIERRQAFDAEIEHADAGLGVIRARLVEARAQTAAPVNLASDMTALRDRMRILTESLSEAYSPMNPNEPSGA